MITSQERILHAEELQIERKHFFIELRENTRGRFLRITEEAHGRRNCVIIPSTGLGDFGKMVSSAVGSMQRA